MKFFAFLVCFGLVCAMGTVLTGCKEETKTTKPTSPTSPTSPTK